MSDDILLTIQVTSGFTGLLESLGKPSSVCGTELPGVVEGGASSSRAEVAVTLLNGAEEAVCCGCLPSVARVGRCVFHVWFLSAAAAPSHLPIFKKKY